MGILERLLAAINRHKSWGWAGLLIYVPSVIFPHDRVQYYVNEIAIHYTHKRLYRGAAIIGEIVGALLTLIVAWSLRRQPARVMIGAFWLATATLIVGTWWGFMANNVELVHFPQYFPEGFVLVALTESPVESIAWATIFGGIDECFQYWFLVQGKPVPYDFNDIYMDLLGAAAGVVFAMAFMHTKWRESTAGWWKRVLKSPGIVVVFGAITAGAALWVSGVMLLYEAPGAPHHWFSLSRQTHLPFWFSIGFLGPRTFHELSPVEGPSLLLLTLAFYSLLDRRLRVSASPSSQ